MVLYLQAAMCIVIPSLSALVTYGVQVLLTAGLAVVTTGIYFGLSPQRFLLFAMMCAALFIICSVILFEALKATCRGRDCDHQRKQDLDRIEAALEIGYMVLHRAINASLLTRIQQVAPTLYLCMNFPIIHSPSLQFVLLYICGLISNPLTMPLPSNPCPNTAVTLPNCTQGEQVLDSVECASCMFVQVYGLEAELLQQHPRKSVAILHELFSAFDEEVEALKSLQKVLVSHPGCSTQLCPHLDCHTGHHSSANNGATRVCKANWGGKSLGERGKFW